MKAADYLSAVGVKPKEEDWVYFWWKARKALKSHRKLEKNPENLAGKRKIPFWGNGKLKNNLRKPKKAYLFCGKPETDPLFSALKEGLAGPAHKSFFWCDHDKDLKVTCFCNTRLISLTVREWHYESGGRYCKKAGTQSAKYCPMFNHRDRTVRHGFLKAIFKKPFQPAR